MPSNDGAAGGRKVVEAYTLGVDVEFGPHTRGDAKRRDVEPDLG